VERGLLIRREGGLRDIMDKIGWKCVTCGEVTYSTVARDTPRVILETTQCLGCMRDGEPVSPSVQQRILAKYASREY